MIVTTSLPSRYVLLLLLLFLPAPTDGVGSASTISISHGTGTVCGLAAAAPTRAIVCYRGYDPFVVTPSTSIDSLSSSRDFFCGLRSTEFAPSTTYYSSLFCWSPTASASNISASDPPRKRLYYGTAVLEGVSVGEDHVSATERGKGISFWRGESRFPATVRGDFSSLTSGNGFSCAIEANTSAVQCWGSGIGVEMELSFRGEAMASIVAGDSHVCGENTSGFLVCHGRNDSGQLGPPIRQQIGRSPYDFSDLALGWFHTCAIRRANGTVICWGGIGNGGAAYSPVGNASFEVIVAGGNLTCGLTTQNFSVVCWGLEGTPFVLPLPQILPGFCTGNNDATVAGCSCGVFPDSDRLCSGSGVICKRCDKVHDPDLPLPSPTSPSAIPTLPPTSRRAASKGFLAFAIVGAVGAFAGLCSILFCIWMGICRQKKVHNSVQPTTTANNRPQPNSPSIPIPTPFSSPTKSMRSKSKSSIFRRQGSRVMRRQRSGPSSSSRRERAEEFTYKELSEATDHFSRANKIGAGSFGAVYRGKLPDGREVAIKRSEVPPGPPRAARFQEKESAFQSELAFLSRLHHKHLVGLVGFCEERDERLLVYEFMRNGALYDHLHLHGGSTNNNNNAASSGSAGAVVAALNSWKMRIKVLLDASRGIEYLHNYAVPPIIHRDIKSSNILLDANWTARVSDFGLSLNGPEPGAVATHVSARAAGTVGYMDPEYYGLHHLTTKSDVYGLGVVMLEVLTGKRAVFKEGDGDPTSVVDFAVRRIAGGEVAAVLDPRVALPGAREAEAVERVANTAMQCVRLEGKDRPAIADVVANLEVALAVCDDSRGSISSNSLNSFD